MTNEEAKAILEKALDNNTIYDVEESYKYITAVHMAIQALEQQPNRCDSCIHSEEQDGSSCYECVKNMADNFEAQPTDADCISREAVIRLIEQYPNIIGNRFSGLISDIKHLSPVTPTNEDIKEAYLKGYDYGVKDWFKSKTQPCEDAISREAVIENVIKCTDMNEDTMEVLENKVKALPFVYPERPKGKWIEVDDNDSHGWGCS